MSFRFSSLKTLGIVLLVTFMASSAMSQFPDIEVKVGDTTGFPGKNNSVISVFLTNRVDSIAGFNIWLQLDRPDIMIFQTDTATIFDTLYWQCNEYFGSDCVDSQLVFDPLLSDFFTEDIYLDTIGNFDTTGTLVSGWDLIDSRSISGVGTDINIAGIASLPGGSSTTLGIPPSFSGGVLIKILADVFNIPDTTTDRVVNILIQSDFKDHLGFSRPNGSSIIWMQEEVPDTSCFRCTQWVGEICFNWDEITFGECDSIDVGTKIVTVLDTANVKINGGSLTVLPGGACGNIDGVVDPVMEIDVSDLVYLVNYLFKEGPTPDPLTTANLNCDDENGDISDLVMFVNFIFKDGPAICECP